MGDERASFEVRDNRFWILEQREEETAEKDGFHVNAWVFNNEQGAIRKMKELITPEVDLENLDKTAKKLGERYNLQEVEIAKDKYNMKAISWIKVALLGLAEK
jgi:hypothetical protein